MIQKQLPDVLYKKNCSQKCCNIHRKTSALESPTQVLINIANKNIVKKVYIPLREKCPIRSFFRSIFSRIPYSVRLRENTDQAKIRIWNTYFEEHLRTAASDDYFILTVNNENCQPEIRCCSSKILICLLLIFAIFPHYPYLPISS